MHNQSVPSDTLCLQTHTRRRASRGRRRCARTTPYRKRHRGRGLLSSEAVTETALSACPYQPTCLVFHRTATRLFVVQYKNISRLCTVKVLCHGQTRASVPVSSDRHRDLGDVPIAQWQMVRYLRRDVTSNGDRRSVASVVPLRPCVSPCSCRLFENVPSADVFCNGLIIT